MNKLTHIDAKGNPAMVDISEKKITSRVAVAQSIVELGEQIMTQLQDGDIHTKKGPVFHTAIIAGTMGAKKTTELVPFCHPVGLDDCKIVITTTGTLAIITCTAKVEAKTGIEMEAITGASIAAITIYDMCKAIDKQMIIDEITLLKKEKKEFFNG